MPGIFGAVAVRSDHDPQPVASAMLDLLRHHQWYRTVLVHEGHRCLGATSTNPRFARENHLAVSAQALLLVEGTAFVIDGMPVPDDAPDLARRMLNLYLAHGDAFIERIGGHFNLVVVDHESARVQICNDKLGFAHLYWYADDQIFLFGPELKAFLAWRGLDRKIDPASAAAFLAHQCPFGCATLLQGVTMLGPASRVVWDGRRVSVTRRWRPEPNPEPERPRRDVLDEAEALFARSIAKRLPADQDGRTVIALSGGLDSRLLLHQVRDRSDLELFTHGQPDCNEYKIAAQVSRQLGLDDRHRLIEIDPDWAGLHARRAVWLNDGQLNMRNATTIGISEVLGPGPYPYLNGIIGSFMSIGGPRCSAEDLRLAGDEAAVQARVLEFSGVRRGAAQFAGFMHAEPAAHLRELAHRQVLEAFAEWSHAPLFGDQKLLFFNANAGRRMQRTNDVLRFQFHDLLPFVDEDLFAFSLRIPLEMKCGMSLYHDFYRDRLTSLARIPWQHTGHDLFTPTKVVRRTADRRQKTHALMQKVRAWTKGRINLRSRDSYIDRPAWLRRNKIFRDEVQGVLSGVGATGCEWFDQKKVDALRNGLDRGQDHLFHILAQIYTMVVWHELFLGDGVRGQELVLLNT
jgi:hypothetical protein